MKTLLSTEANSRHLQYLRVFAMGFSAFIFNTTEFVPVGILTDIAQSFDITTAKAGWMLTIYAWVVALLSLPLMLLTRKVERKTLLLCLFALFTVSHVLSIFAWSFPVLVISRIGIAFSHAIFWSITAAIAIRVAPAGKKTFALSILATGTSLAMVLGVPLGRLIGQWFGWRVTFGVIGVVAFLMMLLLARLLPVLPSVSSGSLKSLSAVFKKPVLIGAYFFTFLIFTAHYSSYSYIEPFMHEVGQSDSYFTTFLLLLFGGAGIIGSVMFAVWGEKHNTVMLVSSGVLIAICMALLNSVAMSTWGISGLIFVWGIVMMLVPVTMQVKVFNIDNDSFEVIMSMYSGIINLGIGAGALIGGKVIIHMGLPNVGYVASGISVVSLAVLFFLLRKYPVLR
ncbi:sugar transporter [Vibrio sp. S17_S38]|uniref:sugar transporter n=1 Tax=Vibrio sp. S17_S38 TaxID=2720229 RepID=UPI001681552E|nr:sugar transporter [Vibrio sp. S17_S38]MBD1572154.1 sugar transporter [Vibrio sp. S17_S38]